MSLNWWSEKSPGPPKPMDIRVLYENMVRSKDAEASEPLFLPIPDEMMAELRAIYDAHRKGLENLAGIRKIKAFKKGAVQKKRRKG